MISCRIRLCIIVKPLIDYFPSMCSHSQKSLCLNFALCIFDDTFSSLMHQLFPKKSDNENNKIYREVGK